MKKKVAFIIISVLLFAVVAWIIGSGFVVSTSVYITDDFEVSEDGSQIEFTVGVGSSAGFVRCYKDEGGGVKPHYLKFYSAWGGFNSSVGAENKYILELTPEDNKIYVYHGDKGYELALQKDTDSGEWHRVK